MDVYVVHLLVLNINLFIVIYHFVFHLECSLEDLKAWIGKCYRLKLHVRKYILRKGDSETFESLNL